MAGLNIGFEINNYNTVQEFIDDIKKPVEYRTQLGFN